MSKYSGLGCRIQQLSSLFYAASTARLAPSPLTCSTRARVIVGPVPRNVPLDIDGAASLDPNPEARIGFLLSSVMAGHAAVGLGGPRGINTCSTRLPAFRLGVISHSLSFPTHSFASPPSRLVFISTNTLLRILFTLSSFSPLVLSRPHLWGNPTARSLSSIPRPLAIPTPKPRTRPLAVPTT